ncbi:hypothetical protein CBOM_01299 [Ceraceosorus bombacis]|uniref:Uncharacterized protein n=1 Tax=Ceraceosorus bombacis TaxID=401625 RepID=A0A0P1BC91_9BASI|nr:hypothetical protein CBOM_01299 [Ceraceosorus bombacis]
MDAIFFIVKEAEASVDQLLRQATHHTSGRLGRDGQRERKKRRCHDLKATLAVLGVD